MQPDVTNCMVFTFKSADKVEGKRTYWEGEFIIFIQIFEGYVLNAHLLSQIYADLCINVYHLVCGFTINTQVSTISLLSEWTQSSAKIGVKMYGPIPISHGRTETTSKIYCMANNVQIDLYVSSTADSLTPYFVFFIYAYL